MRGADIGFNNNISGIASRVTMEMQAMGIPVISYGGEYTPYVARIWDLDSIAEQVERCWNDLSKPGSTVREDTMKYATENYDREKEVKKYVALYEKVMEK
jgi:glycosyltransferase involved in cell wall biosynthesis